MTNEEVVVESKPEGVFSLSTTILILIYSYYSLVQVIYEAFTISAFLMLPIQFVASTAASQTAEGALERKDKTRLPIPFCCWLPSNQTIFHLHTQVECPTVHDRATRCVSFSIPFLHH